MVDIIIPSIKDINDIYPLLSEIAKTSPSCRVIPECNKASASINRNRGLNNAMSDIVIMVDDDISGFYSGWINDLIEPLSDNSIMFVSARLVTNDGKLATMVCPSSDIDSNVVDVAHVPSAACAFRKTELRFCEEYLGSGFEDTHFILAMKKISIPQRVVINNKCKLIHANEQKNQGVNFGHNSKVFSKYWGSW